jgi:hypothetical protein
MEFLINAVHAADRRVSDSDHTTRAVSLPTANQSLGYMRFEVLTAVKLSVLFFWVITPYGLVGKV